MKNIHIIITAAILLSHSVYSFGQDSVEGMFNIPSRHVNLSLTKTTNLIFPYSIKSVDLGSNQVIAQQATGVENILQIKAAAWGFEQTNLTVVTAEGKLYSFTLDYSDSPDVITLQLPVDTKIFNSPDALFSTGSTNEGRVGRDMRSIQSMQPIFKNIGSKNGNVEMHIDGIYIHDHLLYFQIKLTNNSNISYDIDQLRLFIRDLKKSKRTAVQETEIIQEQSLGNVKEIAGKSTQEIVIAVSKFTIPNKKYLGIQLLESNGGRHIELQIKNRDLVKAVTFN